MLKTRSLFEMSGTGCCSPFLLRRRVIHPPPPSSSSCSETTMKRAFSFRPRPPMTTQLVRRNPSSRLRGSAWNVRLRQPGNKLRWNNSTPPPAGAPAAAAATHSETIPEPSIRDLRQLALNQGIPFIGFGFLDNAILIIAGDAIDNSLGVYLGISTLCAAAIGNIISDIAGLGLGTAIEDFCANVLKLPIPNISAAQRTLRSVRMSSNLGMAIGMTIGCIIGMFPLWFIDSHKVERMKKKSHLEALFQDVVTEAKTLIGAESTCLYLRVNIIEDDKKTEPKTNGDEEGERSKKWQSINSGKSGQFMYAASSDQQFQPAVDGEHLYAMYYVIPESAHSPSSTKKTKTKAAAANKDSTSTDVATTTSDGTSVDTKEEGSPAAADPAAPPAPRASDSRFIPIGKGIVSRAVLTGEAWNIPDVRKEPDYLPDLYENDGSVPQYLKHMVVVPVLDAQGQTIAVIRALNKIPDKKRIRQLAEEADDEQGTMAAAARGMLARATTRRIAPVAPPEGFTDADVQILKSLASHVSVSLQRLFRDEESDEMRLRDTIRILKEHGLEGIVDDSKRKAVDRRPALFPR